MDGIKTNRQGPRPYDIYFFLLFMLNICIYIYIYIKLLNSFSSLNRCLFKKKIQNEQ